MMSLGNSASFSSKNVEVARNSLTAPPKESFLNETASFFEIRTDREFP